MAVKRCGAKTRSGGKCGQAAGLGTDHLGHGKCKWHGGASPSGRKAAGRERALTFARGALGAEVPGSPVDAMEEAVRLSRGLVAFYRFELATAAAPAKGRKSPDLVRIAELAQPYTEAIRLERDVAKAALDAGVAERRQRLAERQAQLLAAALADGLAEAFGELATPERRTPFAAVVERRLLVLEAEADDVLEGRELPMAAA
jgi:hypothetical protein